MSNGEGQAKRLGEILTRMGFKQQEQFPTEYVLSDSETNSELFLSLKDFQYDKRMDVGFWWLWVSGFFVSPAGGRLGDVIDAVPLEASHQAGAMDGNQPNPVSEEAHPKAGS